MYNILPSKNAEFQVFCGFMEERFELEEILYEVVERPDERR